MIRRYFLSHLIWWFTFSLIGIYLIWQILSVVLPPKILISQPSEQESQAETEQIILRGQVKRTYFLRLNGKLIPFDFKGNFEQTLSLNEGLNQFSLEAESRFGKKTAIQLRILKSIPQDNS